MSVASLLLNGRASAPPGRGASGLEIKTVNHRLQRRYNKPAIPGFAAFMALVLALGLALASSAQAGIWTATGSLHTARGGANILLPDGRVLAAAGFGNDGAILASAELYHPATGLWSNTGSLATARAEFPLVRLPNGKVLAVGGMGIGGGELPSCELYDPATGGWSLTGPLAAARMMASATLLQNGKVLVAGGSHYVGSDIVALDSAELYDPTTGAWSPTGSLHTARVLAATILLPNGKVLAAGGGGGVDALSSSELYDPGTGLWSYTGSLNTARSCEAPVLLPNGQVLVAGGWYWHWEPEVPVVSYPLSSAELYNPATGLWSYTGSLATARQEQPAVLLPNGQVLTFGGYGFNETILGSAELYDPATGRWRATGSLITARVGGGSAARLLNGKVLAAGGRGSSGSGGMLASAELYHPGEAPPGINLLLLD